MGLFFKLFLFFFIYSVLGWCAEMLYCRMLEGKFVARGFLYGPYCPIYGFGGVIVLIFLGPFKNNIALVFILGMLLTTILEYITSYIMEKIFDAKWWDYSHKPLNINGRICLLNSVLFGLLGVIITYIIHPYIDNLVALIPINILPIISFTLMIILSIDITATLNSLINFKEKLKEIQSLKETLKEKVQSNQYNIELKNKIEEIKQHLIEAKLSSSANRIIKAFPNLKFTKLDSAFEELKDNFIKQTERKLEERKLKKSKKRQQ